MNGNKLFTAEDIDAAVEKIASDIGAEFKGDFSDCALVGIHNQGVPFAQLICESLRKKYGTAPLLGKLDISMYRDDIGTKKSLPPIRETLIPFDINDGIVILTDDVLQTGRTIRAALDAITDYGRPALIRLAVLVDRGLREFPIRADYTGAVIEAPADERLRTAWAEYNEDDAVYSVPQHS